MTAFLILVASIAAGVLVTRFGRKRGSGKLARRLAGVATGVLAFAVLAVAFAPASEAPESDAVATAQADALPVAPATSATSAPVPRYTVVNADSAQAAHAYIANLDLAIDHSIDALPGARLKTVAGYSQRFADLADQGAQDFGTDIDQLGYCAMAGQAADALWHARLIGRAATAQDLQQIQFASDHYHDVRGWCLDRLKR